MESLPVRFREEAIADFEEIAAYLVEQEAHASVILGFLARIRKQCETIGLVPEGYALRDDLGSGIRIAPFERSAIIAFRITEGAVEIVNIFYGGRDYASLMQE